MRKLMQHGKFWLIAVVISLSSYFYMQMDRAENASLPVVEFASLDMGQDAEQEEQSYKLDLDLIKMAAKFVVDVFKWQL